MNEAIVAGSFDNLKSRHMRLLQEAASLGSVHVLLWTDKGISDREGEAPRFSQAERLYTVDSIRYVDRVTFCDCPSVPDQLPTDLVTPNATWVVDAADHKPENTEWSREKGIGYHIVQEDQLATFPDNTPEILSEPSTQKKVIVTGCYDWFHSGHIRFFEEVSELGELYVVVGHDENIRLLKGEGHPMYLGAERRYMAGSIRFVEQALISSGNGWLDAEPEIERIRPDIYAVNEDGDRPEKRDYCDAHGIEYRVLKRTPKEGLPKRQSTDLRGF